jgi:hypothetical protein
MRKSRLLAAGAALTLLVAACGDDDDDAASDDTSAPATIAAPAGGATTPSDGTAAEGAGADATVDAGGVSPELAADCETVVAAFSEIEAAPDDPDVGEEISDEYKDSLRGVVDDLENLDLQTDEVRDAVASLVDFANEVIDADTWSEEFETSAQASFTPLTDACAAAIAEVPTST